MHNKSLRLAYLITNIERIGSIKSRGVLGSVFPSSARSGFVTVITRSERKQTNQVSCCLWLRWSVFTCVRC